MTGPGKQPCPHVARLKHHLQLQVLAEQLLPSRVMSLDRAELTTALERVGAAVALPPSVLFGVLERVVHWDAPSEKSGVQKFVGLLWPFQLPGSGDLNIYRPELALIPATFEEKTAKCLELLFNFWMYRAVAMATKDDQRLLLWTSEAMQALCLRTIAEDPNLGEAENTILCELTTISSGLAALCNLELVLTSPEADSMYSDLVALQSVGDGSRAFLQTVALAIRDSVYLDAKLSMAKQSEAAIIEIRPVLMGINDSLLELQADNDMTLVARAELVRGCLKSWLRVSLGLSSDFWQSLQSRLVTEIGVIYKACLDTKSTASTKDLDATLQLLTDAAATFPDLTTVAASRAALAQVVAAKQREGSLSEINGVLAQTSCLETAAAGLDKLTDLMARLSFSSLGDEMMGKMGTSISTLVQFGVTSWPHGDVDRACDACSELKDVMEPHFVPARAMFCQLLVDSRALHVCSSQLREKLLDQEGGIIDDELKIGDGEISRLLVLLRRCEAYFETPELPGSIASDEEFLKRIHTLIADTSDLKRDIGKVFRDRVFERLVGVEAELVDLQGGLSGGGAWTDSLGNDPNKLKQWDWVFAKAKETIMRDKAVAGMKRKIDAYAGVPLWTTEVCKLSVSLTHPTSGQKHRSTVDRGPMYS